MTDAADRRALIQEIVSAPISTVSIVDAVIRCRGLAALSTESLQLVRDIARMLRPAPETPPEPDGAASGHC